MKHSTWIIALVVGVLVGGAGVWIGTPLVRGTAENHSVVTPTQETRAKLASILPGYVALGDLTVDGTNGSPFPFKGSISPQEDLYSASTKEPDLGDAVKVPMTTAPPAPLTILTVVDKQAVPISLYGKVAANKEVDKWIVGDVTIDSGLDQLGKPRASFPPEAIIPGTADGDKALAGFATAVDDYKQKAAAQLEEQKQAAQKIQAEKDAAAAAYRASLLDAFKAGTTYKGTLTLKTYNDGNNQIEPIQLMFTELTGSQVKVTASNPNVANTKQTFTGNLSLDAPSDPNSFPLTMGPDKTASSDRAMHDTEMLFFNNRDFMSLVYVDSGQLNLRLIEGGLEGTATMTTSQGSVYTYELKLQRTTKPSDNSP
jgi:hypothetical protein